MSWTDKLKPGDQVVVQLADGAGNMELHDVTSVTDKWVQIGPLKFHVPTGFQIMGWARIHAATDELVKEVYRQELIRLASDFHYMSILSKGDVGLVLRALKAAIALKTPALIRFLQLIASGDR